MNLSVAVEFKLSQWNREALMFCAAHGRKGGRFNVSQWANGEWMAEVPNGRANQAIPLVALLDLIAKDFKVYT